jgi:hypothetical protein
VESKAQHRLSTLEDSALGTDSAGVDKNGSGVSEEGISNAYPVVRLDVERITDATAGRLATTLLAHVLFLKNQIPL